VGVVQAEPLRERAQVGVDLGEAIGRELVEFVIV
jgi:hypothetical protein